MPIQAPQWTEFLSCPICRHEFDRVWRQPISLACGHTLCRTCLCKLHRRQCPFDQTSVSIEAEDLPVNTALLQLVSLPPSTASVGGCEENEGSAVEVQSSLLVSLTSQELDLYYSSRQCVHDLALYLKTCAGVPLLSRPMQRKLVTLVTCQLAESEGRARAVRAARSLGERTVTEFILQHQNSQQLSANLWAAVRARGCQFLGPAMQEEVLRLVLLALEDGSALSRKVLVMFVVQRLEPHFPQASKTSIGHVVQLLYRASCFKVSKREGDSSLMQLKEEFRTYEALRREHDAQIVQIATEAGLRIAPDQWSSLLYGDSAHKSHMQSIIDKLQTPQSFGQSVQELVIALQRTGDPHNLSNLRQSLELLAAVDPSPDASIPCWQECEAALVAARLVVAGLVDFISHVGVNSRTNGRGGGGAGSGNGCSGSAGGAVGVASAGSQAEQVAHGSHGIKYKTSLCRDLLRGGCPRGSNCTFAHSEEELDKYRSRHRRNSDKTKNGDHVGSQENLHTAAVGDPVAMLIADAVDATFYLNSALGGAAQTSSSSSSSSDGTVQRQQHVHARSHYGAAPSTAPFGYRQAAQYMANGGYTAPAPPAPTPTAVVGSHVYGGRSAYASSGASLAQPEYAVQAPVMMTDCRPLETARLMPSMAGQSLVVLQNRKQEILDQLEKIGCAVAAAAAAAATTTSAAPSVVACPVDASTVSQQLYSVWNSATPCRTAAVAQTRTTPSSSACWPAYCRAMRLEDDDFIPFDPPICSKYGPISRFSRILPRPSNPVQASASFGHSFISTPVTRTPLTCTGIDWIDAADVVTAAAADTSDDDNDSSDAGNANSACQMNRIDFYTQSERMKYELEMLKLQIDELKMATLATREVSALTEGRQRLARELHFIEENIRDRERDLRLNQRKRRNVATLPVNGKAIIDWSDIKCCGTHSEDEEDNGIASGMRELELRLQHELEEQE